jgi:hypothetical protein
MSNETDRAHSALCSIPSDLDRDTWHRIGRAGIAAGLTIDDIDKWSSKASNYAGTKDVHSAFRSVTLLVEQGLALSIVSRPNMDGALIDTSPKAEPYFLQTRFEPQQSPMLAWAPQRSGSAAKP